LKKNRSSAKKSSYFEKKHEKLKLNGAWGTFDAIFVFDELNVFL